MYKVFSKDLIKKPKGFFVCFSEKNRAKISLVISMSIYLAHKFLETNYLLLIY